MWATVHTLQTTGCWNVCPIPETNQWNPQLCRPSCTHLSSCLTHVCVSFEVKLLWRDSNTLLASTFQILCNHLKAQFRDDFLSWGVFPQPPQSVHLPHPIPSILLGAHIHQSKSKWQRKHLQELLLIAVVPVGHVHRNQERWGGNKDKLKTPEPDVGDWEELIVADILTARLKNRQTYRMCHCWQQSASQLLYSLLLTENTKYNLSARLNVSSLWIRSNKITINIYENIYLYKILSTEFKHLKLHLYLFRVCLQYVFLQLRQLFFYCNKENLLGQKDPGVSNKCYGNLQKKFSVSKFNATSRVVKLNEWQLTCRVLQVKSDCSSPQTLSAATTKTMTRKIKSTESQTLPKLVEWRFTPASWVYRPVQDILERERKSWFNNAFSWVSFFLINK